MCHDCHVGCSVCLFPASSLHATSLQVLCCCTASMTPGAACGALPTYKLRMLSLHRAGPASGRHCATSTWPVTSQSRSTWRPWRAPSSAASWQLRPLWMTWRAAGRSRQHAPAASRRQQQWQPLELAHSELGAVCRNAVDAEHSTECCKRLPCKECDRCKTLHRVLQETSLQGVYCSGLLLTFDS